MKQRVWTRLGALAIVLASAGTTSADEGSVAPPSFDEAMAAARKAGKPLVIELFAVW